MQKIGEKTAEIRSVWDASETHRAWERFDIYYCCRNASATVSDAGHLRDNGSDDHEIQVRNAELFKNALDEAITNGD